MKNSSARILPEGTVLFTSRAGIGNTAILAKESATNQGFQSIVPKDNILDTYFIYSKSHLLKRYGEVQGAGSTFVEISGKEMAKMPLLLPTIKEQIRIGTYLKNLDNIITLHQRKINTLETFKKVYLSVMFTNKNDNTPLLRFKNFTEAWEQCKFKNFVEDISTGRSSFISGKLQSNKNKFPILGSTNLIGYDSSYDYSGNFILTARVGANAGNIYRFQGDVKISDNTIYIQTKNWIFTYYLLLNFNLKRLAFGTGQPLIKASEIEKITFRLPSTAKEYRKIGQCLNNIDNLTTLHQRKLYTLKKLKQAYLNKMFI